MFKVVILNDGETYTSIQGCVVLEVPDTVSDDDLDDYVADNFWRGTPIA